jgi:hypothetical protein
MSANWTGVLLGLYMLLVIVLGFVWVIKLEYYFGARIWPTVLMLGILICLASLFMPSFTTSALLGVFGGSVVWGATELPGQEERVQSGLFPSNPKRKKREDPA